VVLNLLNVTQSGKLFRKKNLKLCQKGVWERLFINVAIKNSNMIILFIFLLKILHILVKLMK